MAGPAPSKPPADLFEDFDPNKSLKVDMKPAPKGPGPASADLFEDIDPSLVVQEGRTTPDRPNFSFSTPAQKIGSIGQGGISGTVKGGTFMAGAVPGMKLGAAAGGLTGPAAPVATPLLATAGFFAGGIAGQEAAKPLNKWLSQVQMPWSDEPLTFEDASHVPMDRRGYFQGGKFFMETFPFIASPYVSHKLGTKYDSDLFGRVMTRIVDNAGRSPGKYAVAELSMAASAGIASGVIENRFPGRPTLRLGGELVGGILNPTRFVISAGNWAYGRIANVFKSHTTAGRFNAAASQLRKSLEKMGVDPADLADDLERILIENPDVKGTLGQITGHPSVIALENAFIKASSEFGVESAKKAEQTFTNIRNSLAIMRASGDPELMRQAVQIEREVLEQTINNYVKLFEDKALESASKIWTKKVTEPDLVNYGKKVTELFDEASEVIRGVIKAKWELIPGELPVRLNYTIDRWTKITRDLEPEQLLELPPILVGFMKRLTGEKFPGVKIPKDIEAEILRIFGPEVTLPSGQKGSEATVKRLLNLRSNLLSKARDVAGNPEKASQARLIGEMAESILDDLGENILVPESVPSGQAGSIKSLIDDARKASYDFHDAFTRSFVGDTMRPAKGGVPRVPPEQVMRAATQGSSEKMFRHFEDLRDAAQLAGQEYVTRLNSLQEDTIRFIANKVVDPLTGRVNERAVAKFVATESRLLKRFPEIRKNLLNAKSAENILKARTKDGKMLTARNNRDHAFSSVIDFEDPGKAIGNVLASKSPSQEYAKTAAAALERGGKDAVDGLAAATFRHVYDESFSLVPDALSGGEKLVASFGKMRDMLLKPPANGTESLLDMMVGNKVISPRQRQIIKRHLAIGVNVEKAIKSTDQAPKLDDAAIDAVSDFALRIQGAAFGKKAADLIPGKSGSLIAQAAGSRLFRGLFQKMPQKSAREFLMEAWLDPKLGLEMLRTAKTQQDKLALNMSLNMWIWTSGIEFQDDFDIEEFRKPRGVQIPVPDNIGGGEGDDTLGGGAGEDTLDLPEGMEEIEPGVFQDQQGRIFDLEVAQ